MNEEQPSTQKGNMFWKKKGQLDDQVLNEIEWHHSVQDSRKFYKRVNDTRKPFEPAIAMYWATKSWLIKTKSCQEDLHTNQESPWENDSIIDLPGLDEIVKVIKYLKDNKAAVSDSVAAKLLKTGGPSLVNTLNEMI
jgi:hypothetical protein